MIISCACFYVSFSAVYTFLCMQIILRAVMLPIDRLLEKRCSLGLPYILCETCLFHYDNTPMQYTGIFHCCKNVNFEMKKCDIFSCFCSKHRLLIHVKTASVRRF